MLFGVLPIGCGGSVFVVVSLCITLSFLVLQSILKRKGELVALLLLSYECLVTVNVL